MATVKVLRSEKGPLRQEGVRDLVLEEEDQRAAWQVKELCEARGLGAGENEAEGDR